MTLDELKEKLSSGNITLKEKENIPTPEDYKMGLMLKEYLNTPLFFEEIPPHLMFTEKDPYATFRRVPHPYRVNRAKFKVLKIAKREDSPIESMYAKLNKEDQEEFIKFAALPKKVRNEVYGYDTNKAYIDNHNVSQRQISFWLNDDEVIRKIRNQRIKFFDQKTSEILYAFYEKTIQHADANRVNIWLTKIAGLKDETVVDNKFTIEWKPPEPVGRVVELVEQTNSENITKLLQNENSN